jgi:glycosyltransferase involved in cell wall biosynthesis
LRIAIDASRTTAARITGTELYSLQMIRALIRLNTRHTITLYFRDAPPMELLPASPLVTTKVIPFSRLWTHVRFAAELWRDRPDVTWVPAHTLPALFPGRAALTIHDLGYKHFPDAHPTNARRYLEWTTRYSAQRANVVLADSMATARDLTELYDTPSAKIRVVYPGVDAPPKGDIEEVRRKYNLPERYFLSIGTLQPRKNIARLVQAYAKAAVPDVGLVLAGAKGWLYDPEWTEGVEGIVMPGYVDEADKGALYDGALALLLPSLYEGFGFPVLEAMHSGTPVLCSRTSSLPELAGDAALLVDPMDVDSIAVGMVRLATDGALRQSLRAKGYVQALRFTWASAAKTTLTALEYAVPNSLD